MKILVNTISTKKHAGGAYQIAYNFLVKTLEHQEVEWIYVVSSDLDVVLPGEMKIKGNYHVFPTQPDYRQSYKKVKKELRELERIEKPDVVYSVTAPSYFTFDTVEVMRFTNPWVTHPNKYSWAVLSWRNRITTRLYCWNQRRMMRKAKYFVTQTETTKNGIVKITGVPNNCVCVVNNVLPAFFTNQETSHIRENNRWIDIACVGAPVPHKNFIIIPDVIHYLKEAGIDKVRFHTTIPENSQEWSRIVSKLKEYNLETNVINHGRVSQADLALMYRHCLYCFLPTLLEVFSASTLEAMYFKLPIVATDFDFNRDVMGDACLYYEPMNAEAAALQIKKYVENQSLVNEMKQKMDERLKLFGDYDRHFNDILDFLRKVVEENSCKYEKNF